MIRKLLEEGHSEENVVEILMGMFRISRAEAEFRIDIVLGRTDGDVQAVDQDSEETSGV